MTSEKDCIVAYERLWAAIRERSDLTDAALARDIGADQAALSRMIRGQKLPRRHKMLVAAAEKCGADESEIRLLMAIVGAIQAYRDDEDEVASYYSRMFNPLFSQDAYKGHLNSPRTVAANILFDRGISITDEVSQILGRIPGSGENFDLTLLIRELFGLAAQGRSDISAVIDNLTAKQIRHSLKTYQNLVALDFRWEWVRLKHPPRLRKKQRQTNLEAYTCAALPHVQITIISFSAGEDLDEPAHGGTEFIFLCRGSGKFKLEGMNPVSLHTSNRRFIAHNAQLKHSFVAGADGAELVVIDYCRPNKDRIDPAIQAAERRTRILKREHGDQHRS
jgi:transcriptional regulator with XRE-family HTH domain